VVKSRTKVKTFDWFDGDMIIDAKFDGIGDETKSAFCEKSVKSSLINC